MLFFRALLLVLAAASVAAAQDIGSSRRTAIVTAIEKVSPAVVTINVVDIRTSVTHPFFDDFYDLFDYGFRIPRQKQKAVESIGTGFIFDARGHILTNYHVLKDADAITSVTLSDGRVLDVEFVGADERTDLAILRAKGENLPYAQLGSSEDLMIGEWVIAIGNPFGNMMRDPQPSVSVGVVSANHRRVSRDVGAGDRLYQDLIQTDAAINPGNSGGPLVNARGEVVGVNTMIFSNTGGYQGLGFAIPIDRVKRVAQEVIQYGRRRNPWMGFRGEAVSNLKPFARRELGVDVDEGVIVTEIMRGCPAADAGLKLGDVVIGINGEPVTHPSDIDFENWDLFIGDRVELTINRRGVLKKCNFPIKELAKP
jgi:serine protease Do